MIFVAVEGILSSGTVSGDLRHIQRGIQRKVELSYPECENLIEIIGSFVLLSEISRLLTTGGHAVAQLVAALRSKPEGRGFDSRWHHRNFSSTLSFRPHYGPWVDSASNRNECPE
jgi:hypothetical protein